MSAEGRARARPVDHLFVYGTLMSDFSRRRLLGPASPDGPGRIRGSLYDLGEYPGAVLDGAGWVAGELYRVHDPARRLAPLDREEGYDPADEAGSLYVRRRVSVERSLEPPCEAWVYVYNGSPGRGPRIDSGDWRACLAARLARSG